MYSEHLAELAPVWARKDPKGSFAVLRGTALRGCAQLGTGHPSPQRARSLNSFRDMGTA